MNSSGSGSSRYRQLHPRQAAQTVTVLLTVICVVVAVLSQLGRHAEPVRALYFKQALTQEEMLAHWQHEMERMSNEAASPQRPSLSMRSSPFSDIVQKGQVWRLVTPIFLHFGVLHLVFNLMWLWQLGLGLESTLRSWPFAWRVLLIAVVSNCCQALVAGPQFGGMSGVVYGLFGFAVIRAKFHPDGSWMLSAQAIRWMLVWLILGFTGVVGPVANGAHLAGLAAGAGLAAIEALRAGAWGRYQRRQSFFAAVEPLPGALHACVVCGLTELTAPDAEFRVWADGQEYCDDHLPSAAG